MDELDHDLIGLAPVKQRIRDIAALLVVDRLRLAHGLQGRAQVHRPGPAACLEPLFQEAHRTLAASSKTMEQENGGRRRHTR